MADCFWPNWQSGGRAFYLVSPNKKSAEHFLYRFRWLSDIGRYKIVKCIILLPRTKKQNNENKKYKTPALG